MINNLVIEQQRKQTDRKSERISNFMSSSIYKYSIFMTFVIFLYIQCLLFQWSFYGVLEPIASLWYKPFHFLNYYIGKILMPLLVASLVLITKRYWWTIIVYLLILVWSIANMMYFSFCDVLLDWPSVFLVSNMSGAWSSISVLWTLPMTIMAAVWGGYVLIFALFHHVFKDDVNVKKIHYLLWGGCVMCVLCLQMGHNAKVYKSRTLLFPYQLVDANDAHIKPKVPKWIPFGVVVNTAQCSPIRTYPGWKEYYVEKQSIISYLVAMPIYEYFLPSHKVKHLDKADAAYKEMLSYLHYDNNELHKDFIPQKSLCILLIESLESWPIENTFEQFEITPNLNKLVKNEHVLYCSKMKSQIRRGNSADGQMMLNTGLLPLEDGVACMQYGGNTYPNFAHCFESSVIVNPWPNIWNQNEMTKRYGYQTMIEPVGGVKEGWEDNVVMAKAMEWMTDCKTAFCSMIITQSTHVPFNHISTVDFADISSEMTPSLVNYIKSVHWCDSCIGVFLDCWMADEKLSNSMLIITGDHTILDRVAFSQGRDLPAELSTYAPDGLYVPFILYSPNIVKNKRVDEPCFQMDMFPTIVCANGGARYYWHGFGKNLLDTIRRAISESEGFQMSDRMIKCDFFNTLDDKN